MCKPITWHGIEIAVLCLLVSNTLFAQIYEKKIIEYVRMISEGHSDMVKPKVVDLKKKIPRAAGIIYVEGLITEDENESLRCFHVIVDSFPRSEWADDALARLFEYHMRVGKLNYAEKSYNVLQSDYPNSPYLTTGYLTQQRLGMGVYADDSVPPHSQGQEWAIQIGAFSLRENAEKLQQKFIRYGYKVNVYENLLDGKNLLYLVWVGSFDKEEDAYPLLTEIKTKYHVDGVLRMRTSWKKW